MTLARDLGLGVVEAVLPRELLYVADEVFAVGTAAEITLIPSIDRIPVGNDRRARITQAVQRALLDVIVGALPDARLAD